MKSIIRTTSLAAATLLSTLGLQNVQFGEAAQGEALQRQGASYDTVWLEETTATVAEPRTTQGTFASVDNGWQRSRANQRRPNGPGWTDAHVQRMAKTRRNQQRNKRAHRGGR